MKDGGTALVTRTADTSRIEDYFLQVLPHMSWLNVNLDTSFSAWIRDKASKLNHSVSNTSNGSYRLSIERDGVERTVAEFTKQGLPTLIRDVNRKPGERARISRFEWLGVGAEEFPHPVKLVQRLNLADGKPITLLEIDVSEFRPKLKAADPSLAIPPAELPAGTPIRDMR